MDDFSPMPISSLLRVAHKHDGTILLPDAADVDLMHWNINHLTNKLNDVELYVSSFPGLLHVVAISETWLSHDNYDTYNLPGYTAIHNIRSSDGGGVTIFIHDSLCGSAPEVIVNFTSPQLHHFLVVKIESINTTIAVPYNRPKGSKSAFFSDLQRLCLELPDVVLMGDFNMNQLDPNKNEEMLEVLESNGFGLLNSITKGAVTRLKSGYILDLVATNMLGHAYKVSIVHNDTSDHAIVYTSINRKICTSATRPAIKSKFNLNVAASMVASLCATDPTDLDGNDLNIALESIVSTCTSSITIKSDHRIIKRHVNRELILAVRERCRLYTLMNLYPDNSVIKGKFDRIVQFIKAKNFELRSAFETERIESAAGDSRKTWKLYKEIVFNRFKRDDNQKITINGVPVGDSVQSCNEVNEHFCSAGERLATEIISIHGYETDDIAHLYPEHSNNEWSFNEVDTEDVTSTINSLPNKKSTGIDKVPISLLKATSLVIAPLIVFCFNLAIQTTVFPVELLRGRLKLIHKKGSSDIENFRGLTLLPSLSKVFECLLVKQLTAYLDGLNFFKGNQFGFIRHSCCLSAAYQLVDFIKSSYRKKFVAVIFIDLKRAFDTVDPRRLSLKLKRIGLSTRAAELMMSYLCNRNTATTIKDNCSTFRSVSIGVAQGSKLGPLHFIIYIADMLTLGLVGRMILYADDTALLYACDTAEELEETMQRDALILNEWLCRNVLTMNVGKTCYMTFGKARKLPDFNIMINGESIQRVSTFKYLGLVLDDNLTFKAHIDHVMKLIRPFIPLMWKRGRFIPLNKRKQIYFAYVQSHIAYMLPIYSSGPKSKLKQLQRVQNRCIKALHQLPRLTPSTFLYSTSILPVEKLAIVERVSYMHKVARSFIKHNFDIRLNSDIHNHRTRQANDLHCPDKHPALQQSAHEYNTYCSDLRRLNCIKTFRDKLKVNIMTNCHVYKPVSPYLYLN